jgi:hypothetical protein
LVFQDGAGGVGAFAGSQYHEIQDLQQLTPNGDLLSVSQMLINVARGNLDFPTDTCEWRG